MTCDTEPRFVWDMTRTVRPRLASGEDTYTAWRIYREQFYPYGRLPDWSELDNGEQLAWRFIEQAARGPEEDVPR